MPCHSNSMMLWGFVCCINLQVLGQVVLSVSKFDEKRIGSLKLSTCNSCMHARVDTSCPPFQPTSNIWIRPMLSDISVPRCYCGTRASVYGRRLIDTLPFPLCLPHLHVILTPYSRKLPSSFTPACLRIIASSGTLGFRSTLGPMSAGASRCRLQARWPLPTAWCVSQCSHTFRLGPSTVLFKPARVCLRPCSYS